RTHPTVPRRRCLGVRTARGAVPAAGLSSGLPAAARSRGGLGLCSGGVRAGVSLALVLPRAVGVLHVVVPDRRQHRNRPETGSRSARARVRSRARIGGGMKAHHGGFGSPPRSGGGAVRAARANTPRP